MIRPAIRTAALIATLAPLSYIEFAHATPVPGNDDIESAILVTGPGFSDRLQTSAAPDEPICANGNGHSVRYVDSREEDEVIHADTFGINDDTTLTMAASDPDTGGPLPVEFKREPRLKIDVDFQDGLLGLDGQARFSAELNCSLPAQVNLSLALIQKAKGTSVGGTFDLGPISCSGPMIVFLGPIAADDGVFVPGHATVEALVIGTTIVGAIPYEDEVAQKIELTTLSG
jgi:hypothetical protein